MAESDVGGVISAETGTADGHVRAVAFAPGQVEDVIDDHVFVGVMRPHPVSRMNALIIETLKIDRVGAINRAAARIDVGGNGSDQAEILILEVAAERRWKEDQREAAAFAEGKHLEVAVEPRG